MSVSSMSHATDFVTRTKLINVSQRIMNRSEDVVWNGHQDSCACLSASPLLPYMTVPKLVVETVHSCLKSSQRYMRDALKQCEVIRRSASALNAMCVLSGIQWQQGCRYPSYTGHVCPNRLMRRYWYSQFFKMSNLPAIILFIKSILAQWDSLKRFCSRKGTSH